MKLLEYFETSKEFQEYGYYIVANGAYLKDQINFLRGLVANETVWEGYDSDHLLHNLIEETIHDYDILQDEFATIEFADVEKIPDWKMRRDTFQQVVTDLLVRLTPSGYYYGESPNGCFYGYWPIPSEPNEEVVWKERTHRFFRLIRGHRYIDLTIGRFNLCLQIDGWLKLASLEISIEYSKKFGTIEEQKVSDEIDNTYIDARRS